MKYLWGAIIAIVVVLAADYGYVVYQTKKMNTADHQIQMVNEGRWCPVHAYHKLVHEGRQAEADSFATVYIQRLDGQVMSHAKQLPTESRSDYLERINRGRSLMGFTQIDEAELFDGA